ncbi:glucosaminidase domain-containing protein [Clostridium aestuarii]|uniref:Glucosaminidase domain-containing protein n=1 Tax=Clostridium aestuarii TaxID=338193 RepID=A0ABT4D105_9CLOT|nr:glucosaminidase domain-containing protein [Clostridium aestuarii]MCY6484914.1 glucosaminidase domain-containing protein [Clostridium aestuarii]
MDKVCIKRGVISLLLVLGLSCSYFVTAKAESTLDIVEYKQISTLNDVSVKKEFTLTFDEKIDEKVLENRYIELIETSSGKKVSLSFEALDDKNVKVIPKKLNKDKTYYLIVNKPVQTEDKKLYKKGVLIVVNMESEKKLQHDFQVDLDGDLKISDKSKKKIDKKTVDNKKDSTEKKTTENKKQPNKNDKLSEKISILSKSSRFQDKFIGKVLKGASENYEKHKILPSVTIAQAIWESGWGRSEKATKYNNLFGIKAGKTWTGKSVKIKSSKWRVYSSWKQSINDHATVLLKDRYVNAGVFKASNYVQQIKAIQKGGYCSGSSYVGDICKIINKYNLWQYDVNGKELSY